MDSSVYRPNFPALLVAAACVLAGPAALAQTSPKVDLFIDLAGEDVGEAMQVGTAASGVAIDGIPLTVGVAEDAAAEGWHVVAGARGRYGLELGHGLDLIARGSATRTTFVDDRTLDRAGASGAAELRWRKAGWQFGLVPGVAVTHRSAGGMQRDGTIDGRIARPITGTLGIAANARYRWRDFDGGEASRSEAMGGRIGITCRLPAARLEAAYAGRRETWTTIGGAGGPAATFAHGPSLSAALPLHRDLKLKAGYSLTETESNGELTAVDHLHQLNLGLTWDVGGMSSDVALSFRYRFEQSDAEGADALHVGTVNLALGF